VDRRQRPQGSIASSETGMVPAACAWSGHLSRSSPHGYPAKKDKESTVRSYTDVMVFGRLCLGILDHGNIGIGIFQNAEEVLCAKRTIANRTTAEPIFRSALWAIWHFGRIRK
jgi:hypothetical protein